MKTIKPIKGFLEKLRVYVEEEVIRTQTRQLRMLMGWMLMPTF